MDSDVSDASFFIKNRGHVITVFKLLYFVFLAILLLGGRVVLLGTSQVSFFSQLAVNFGRLGLVLYILTIIPGMARRFGIQHSLAKLLMVFRRYIGILMYMSVMIHYWLLRGVFMFLQGAPFQFVPFEFAGTLALFFVLPAFITSNNFSVRKLGVWWKRLQKLTYISIGFIFLHIILQEVNGWSIAIGIALGLQLASFIYQILNKQKTVN